MGTSSRLAALLPWLSGCTLLVELVVGCSRPEPTAPPEATTAMPAAPSATVGTTALAARQRTILFDEHSPFQRVIVTDEGDLRLLQFGDVGGFVQSAMSLSHPRAVVQGYLRLALLGMLHSPEHERVLMIGLGGGTFTKTLRAAFPDLWIDVVEIDPVVIRAAKEFFQVREDPRFRIHVGDGVEFIKRSELHYDLVLVDAYGKDGPAASLTTRAFYESLRDRLSDRGIAVVNLAVSAATEQRLERRFRRVFSDVQCSRTQRGDNVVLYGKKAGQLLQRSHLEAAAQQFAVDRDLPFDLAAETQRVARDCPSRPGH